VDGACECGDVCTRKRYRNTKRVHSKAAPEREREAVSKPSKELFSVFLLECRNSEGQGGQGEQCIRMPHRARRRTVRVSRHLPEPGRVMHASQGPQLHARNSATHRASPLVPFSTSGSKQYYLHFRSTGRHTKSRSMWALTVGKRHQSRGV